MKFMHVMYACTCVFVFIYTCTFCTHAHKLGDHNNKSLLGIGNELVRKEEKQQLILSFLNFVWCNRLLIKNNF